MAETSRRDRKREVPDRPTRTNSATTEEGTDTRAETLVETDRCLGAAICEGAYG